MMRLPNRGRIPAALSCAALAIGLLAGCSGDEGSQESQEGGGADESAAFCEEHAAIGPDTAFKKWREGWAALANSDVLEGLPAQVRQGVELQADLAVNSFTTATARALKNDLVAHEAAALDELTEYVEENC